MGPAWRRAPPHHNPALNVRSSVASRTRTLEETHGKRTVIITRTKWKEDRENGDGNEGSCTGTCWTTVRNGSLAVRLRAEGVRSRFNGKLRKGQKRGIYVHWSNQTKTVCSNEGCVWITENETIASETVGQYCRWRYTINRYNEGPVRVLHWSRRKSVVDYGYRGPVRRPPSTSGGIYGGRGVVEETLQRTDWRLAEVTRRR